MLLVMRKNKIMRGIQQFMGDSGASRRFPHLRYRRSNLAVLGRSLRLLLIKS